MNLKIMTTFAAGAFLALSLTACGAAPTPANTEPAPKPSATQEAPSTPTATPNVAVPVTPEGESFPLTAGNPSITYEGVIVTCPADAIQVTIYEGNTDAPVCEFPVVGNDEITDAINEAENG